MTELEHAAAVRHAMGEANRARRAALFERCEHLLGALRRQQAAACELFGANAELAVQLGTARIVVEDVIRELLTIPGEC